MAAGEVGPEGEASIASVAFPEQKVYYAIPSGQWRGREGGREGDHQVHVQLHSAATSDARNHRVTFSSHPAIPAAAAVTPE